MLSFTLQAVIKTEAYLCTGKSDNPAHPAGSPLDRICHMAVQGIFYSDRYHSHACFYC